MAEYKPLFMYLEPASIPQIVAHIQKYLAENPIISDEETIANLIREYIAEHPEIIAVASVNGKVGAVVLTGSDIMINPSSAVSVETQLLNLASMIDNVGTDITQIKANISQIYTNIETLQTSVETNASNISALQTSVEGQGTRLATAETDIDNLETAQTAQGTRLETAETDIDNLETSQTEQGTKITAAEGNISSIQTKVEQIENEMPKILHFDAEITVVPNTNFNTINFESFGVDRNQIISLVLLYTEAVYYDIPHIALGTGENLIYVKLAQSVTVNRVYKVRAFYLE